MDLKQAVRYCTHDYREYPDIFDTNVGLDVVDPIKKLHAVKSWEGKRTVSLKITSWIGISWEAIHYYGKLIVDGVNMEYDDEPDVYTSTDEKKYPLGSSKYELKINRLLTKEEFDKEPDRWRGFDVGELVNAYENVGELINHAKEIIRLRFVGDWNYEIIYPSNKKETLTL